MPLHLIEVALCLHPVYANHLLNFVCSCSVALCIVGPIPFSDLGKDGEHNSTV